MNKEKLNDIVCESSSDYAVLNDAYNYIEDLEQQVKKQKKVIDKTIELINRMDKECEEEGCSFVNLIEVIKIKDILKEV